MENKYIGAIIAGIIAVINIGLMYSDQYLEIKGNVILTFFVLLVYMTIGFFIADFASDKLVVKNDDKKRK